VGITFEKKEGKFGVPYEGFVAEADSIESNEIRMIKIYSIREIPLYQFSFCSFDSSV